MSVYKIHYGRYILYEIQIGNNASDASEHLCGEFGTVAINIHTVQYLIMVQSAWKTNLVSVDPNNIETILVHI